MTTEEARKFALQHACMVVPNTSADEIVQVAAKFEAFLLRNDDILRRPDPINLKKSAERTTGQGDSWDGTVTVDPPAKP